MSRPLTALTAAFLAAFSVPATAQIAVTCANHETVVGYLGTAFGEKRRAYGYTTNGMLVELFVSSRNREVAGNTFTIVVTSPEELQSCMVTGGSEWTIVPAGRSVGGKDD